MEFCDDGYSGMHFYRPGIQKLFSFAGNPITCIIVKDFSRFGRNLIEVGNYLDQVFPFLGVRFIAVNENYDSKRNQGSSISLEVSLKAMLGEMYSRDISEKIRCVQQVKMQKGEYLCAIAFYGYRRSKTQKNKLVVDKPAAAIVRRIFSMAAEGNSLLEIATRLNQDGIESPLMYRRTNHTDKIRGWNTAGEITYWTQENVKRILSDERYTGCLISHKRTKVDPLVNKTKAVPKSEWIVAENTQEAIVSKELFWQVQKKISYRKNPVTEKRQKQKYYNFVKCAYCKRTLQQSKGKEIYFSCPTKKTVPDIPCKEIRLKEKDLEKVLFRSLQIQMQLAGQLVFEEKDRQMVKELEEIKKRYQREKNRYKTIQAILFEKYAEGHIRQQDYLFHKKEGIKQQQELEKKVQELSKQAELLQNRINGMEKYGSDVMKKEQKAELLKELIKTVWIRETDRIEIVWKFKE